VPKSNASKPSSQRDRKGKLEVLFDQERGFARGAMPIVMVGGIRGDQCLEEERRERVEERESVVMEEEKWRFQAEMLRAECNLLRMEREIAVKKMERRRVQMERILRSAVRALLSVSNSFINS
jgi:small subunit ribosomal protein S2e